MPVDFGKHDLTQEQKDSLINKIKAIIRKHTLCAPDWTEAISAQNFLAELSLILGMARESSFKELLNVFLSSFSPQFDGGFKVNERNILIIPDENQKLINCMVKEDETDTYYHGALSATQIKNPDRIYKNYLYGTMVNIAISANNNQLNNVFEYCINELLSLEAMDLERGGWYHYRLPWITARILLSIHNILSNDHLAFYSSIGKIELADKKGLDSLIERIYDEKYWRSGAGSWVSMWESTGLCLEAFITSDSALQNRYYVEKIDKVITYLFQDGVINQWLPEDVDFSTEDSANTALAQIVLCSVLYRYIHLSEWTRYATYGRRIGELFTKVIDIFTNSDKINARQFCTAPQILLYIAKAIKK